MDWLSETIVSIPESGLAANLIFSFLRASRNRSIRNHPLYHPPRAPLARARNIREPVRRHASFVPRGLLPSFGTSRDPRSSELLKRNQVCEQRALERRKVVILHQKLSQARHCLPFEGSEHRPFRFNGNERSMLLALRSLLRGCAESVSKGLSIGSRKCLFLRFNLSVVLGVPKDFL